MIGYTLLMGDTAPKLSEQIHGIPNSFDDMADAVTMLSVHGVLAGNEAHNARKRIVRKINQWVAKQSKNPLSKLEV